MANLDSSGMPQGPVAAMSAGEAKLQVGRAYWTWPGKVVWLAGWGAKAGQAQIVGGLGRRWGWPGG